MTSLVLLTLWSTLGAQAKEVSAFSIDSGTVSYKIVHKFHDVIGKSKSATGSARLMSDGKLEFRAVVPVATFDSGNANRDEHMLEAVEGVRYKNVEVRATVPSFKLPKKFPAKAKLKVPARVRFHGEEREEELTLSIQFLDAKRVSVSGTFTVSLESYKVERPSLMFVKIDDPMTVTADLLLKKTR